MGEDVLCSARAESSADNRVEDARKLTPPSYMRNTSSSLQKSAGPKRTSGDRIAERDLIKKKLNKSRSMKRASISVVNSERSRLPSSFKITGLPVKKMAKLASFTKSSRRMSCREIRSVRPSLEKAVAVESTKLCPYSYCSLHGHHSNLVDHGAQERVDHCEDEPLGVDSETCISTNSSYSNEAFSNEFTSGRDGGLWDRIHRNMVFGLSTEDGNQVSIPAGSGNHEEATDAVQESAIKIVQEAFSKILEKIPDDNVPDGKQGRKSFNNWSRVKKLILLKRFVAIIEQAKHINETELMEPGKVYLRHSVVEDRRASEEWMVDYVLRRVITSLPAIEKKKVALLVQAFESVLPQFAAESPSANSNEQETTQMEESHSSLRILHKLMATTDDSTMEPTGKDEHPESPNEESVRLIEEAIDGIRVDNEEDNSIEREEKSKNARPRRNWGNAKKLLLVQSFMKTIKGVETLSRRKLERSESERRKAKDYEVRDWMLDHALQRVVCKLTPERKKKVQLLVEAFESVNI